MLDPDAIKDRTEEVSKMLKARYVQYDLDALVALDAERRWTIIAADELRAKRNRMGVDISQAKKRGEDASRIISQMGRMSSDLDSAIAKCDEAESAYRRMARAIPNMIDSSVPVGPDDSANVQVRTWGDATRLRRGGGGYEPKNHVDIAEGLDLIDLKRAAKAAGARFYYLKGDLARLNYALIRLALDYLAEREYVAVQPPYMINRDSMEGAVIADDFEDVIYKIDGEDLYMIGTSEHAIAAMHADEILDGTTLPIRYAGVSPCFRKEAGSHGRDQKGIFRVHQFEKIEQFVFARPEDSWAEHERMLQTAEGFYKKLGIPHRTMLLSSGDMGKTSAKTYDIEAWMAGQHAYREIVSCSNCLEYQARRLKIRFRDRTNDATTYVHTLNSTLVATTRVLVAIMEDFQTADGHVTVPDALVPYMGGQKEI